MTNLIREIYLAAKDRDLGKTVELLYDLKKSEDSGKYVLMVILNDYLSNNLKPEEFCECIIMTLGDNPTAVGQRAPQDIAIPNQPIANQ